MRHDQLIPGRPGLIENFGRIERFRGSVEAIEGARVTLSDGHVAGCGIVLWGTGYATDLCYFEDARLASIRSVNGFARAAPASSAASMRRTCISPVWAWTASAPRRGPTC